MRRASALLAIAALVAAPAAVFAAEPFAADLTPGAEVPPAESDGSGSATVTISDDETEISYEVTYEGLTGAPVAAHIHFGGPDVAGPVILPLAHGDSPFSGTLTEADFVPGEGGEGPQTFAEAMTAIRDGETYVNVHTEANPAGEIRGQLEAIPDTAISESETAAPAAQTALLLLLVGLAGFVLTFRRFAFRRA
ncbi:MAG TPA: CHRD domain-containing protein [Candidatus Caenarcaniphilales bacterium]|nr:CHRD domain-containing protein [Candidatus Caenarcaniphilales bacterium]